MSFRNALLRVAVAGVLLAASAPVLAQTPEEIKAARTLAGEGLQAYNNNEFEKALGLFEKARASYPSAQVLRMIGYSALAVDKWGKALEALEASLNATVTPLSKEDKKDVQDQLTKVLTHIGTVTVTSKVQGTLLAVDGGEAKPLDKPLRLQEGTHKLVVTAPDHLEASQDIKVEGGKPLELTLEPPEKPKPKPPPPPPPPPPPKPERSEWVPHQRLIGYGAAGTGVLFGAAALVTVIEAAHWRSVANADVAKHKMLYGDRCAMGDPRLCAFDIEVTNREADTANHLRNAAAGLGVTAAVLAATGVVFVIMAPKPKQPADSSGPQAAPNPALPTAAQISRVTVGCGLMGMSGLFCHGSF